MRPSGKGPESQERYVLFQTLVVAHSVALGKSPNLSAPSLQNVKQTEKGLGEFISLVERFGQLGSISAIMTSFYLQEFGSSPHFTFDSQVDLQVNESSQQQSVEHFKSPWFAASRENVRDSLECYLKGLSTDLSQDHFESKFFVGVKLCYIPFANEGNRKFVFLNCGLELLMFSYLKILIHI